MYKFHKLKGEVKPFYLGIELEAEMDTNDLKCTYSAGRAGINALNTASFDVTHCNDGGGIELQFPPATFSFIKKKFSIYYAYIKMLKELNFKSVSLQAGMHIHVDKTALTSSQFLKMVTFLSKNHALTNRIARRPRNHDYKESSKLYLDDYDDSYESAYCNDGGRSLKEVFESTVSTDLSLLALNRKGLPTIEFRLFNSTLDPLIFLANVEFTHCLILLMQSAKPKVTSTDFMAYLKVHRLLYPHLCLSLKDLKYKVEITKKVKEKVFDAEEESLLMV